MAFDPYTQNVTLLRADGSTKVLVPVPAINALQLRVVTEALMYASQLGACIVLLLVVLILTPSSKLLRPTTVLHIVGLAVGALRMILLAVYFFTPFLGFYEYWAWDFSHIARRYYLQSQVGMIPSFVLLLVTQAALMNQAWTMVRLWPRWGKWSVSLLSGAISLLAVALKLVLVIAQVRDIKTTTPPVQYIWLAKASLVVITLSTAWFCAVFNSKLVHHIISNRGVLPSRRALTPVEVLIMANGILMIIPVVFTALQWSKNTIYEPGSFALTSVVIILPLGSLAAQRIAQAPQMHFNPSAGASGGYHAKSMTMSSDAVAVAPGALDHVDRELRRLEHDDDASHRGL